MSVVKERKPHGGNREGSEENVNDGNGAEAVRGAHPRERAAEARN